MTDAWRVLHETDRDYTFFSPVHGSYSRLDYFMVDHRLLDFVKETRIGITTLSDHVPVLMRVGLPGCRRPSHSWQLDEKLLDSPIISSKIQEEIEGTNFIDKIQNKKGILKHTSRDIAEEFRRYYASLYKVRHDGKGTLQREEKMDEFIREAGLPTLSDSDAKELDGPITVEEIERAVRASPSGKSLGLDGFTVHLYKKFGKSYIPSSVRSGME